MVDTADSQEPDWENVSVSSLTLKVADLGLSRFIDAKTVKRESHNRLTKEVGTPAYWAPEVLTGEYGLSADVYSLGIITFEMLMKRRPGENGSEKGK